MNVEYRLERTDAEVKKIEKKYGGNAVAQMPSLNLTIIIEGKPADVAFLTELLKEHFSLC